MTGVVVALGGKTSDVGPTMLQDGTANIVAACKANGVKRISVVTTIGEQPQVEPLLSAPAGTAQGSEARAHRPHDQVPGTQWIRRRGRSGC